MPSLRIDLLPAHFAQRRLIKKMLAISVVLLLATVGAWAALIMKTKGEVADKQAELDRVKDRASVVDKIRSETGKIKNQRDAIEPKVDFVDSTRDAAVAYFDRFHKINEYIPETAQLTLFDLSGTPGQDEITVNRVRLQVITGTDQGTAELIFSLRRCPHIANFTVSSQHQQGGAGGGQQGGVGDSGTVIGEYSAEPRRQQGGAGAGAGAGMAGPAAMGGGMPAGGGGGMPAGGVGGAAGGAGAGGGAGIGRVWSPPTDIPWWTIEGDLAEPFTVPILFAPPAGGGAGPMGGMMGGAPMAMGSGMMSGAPPMAAPSGPGAPGPSPGGGAPAGDEAEEDE
jgi:hypothetical protein